MCAAPQAKQHDPPALRLPILVILALVVVHSFGVLQAQQPALPPEEVAAEPNAPRQEDRSLETSSPAIEPDEDAAARLENEGINIFQLLVSGGYFMLPILFMSLVVVTFAIERSLGLRHSRVLPPELVNALGQLGERPGGFDPRQAYRICQQFPSTASTIVRTMLLKIGRPHSEVEHSVAEASEREAARLYSNVRWLNLAATVTPLLGLLGTVWGLIRAFHDTTQLAPGWNKAEYLAEGIYIALVTTLSGLVVAIPAAILAHLFEGRIQTLFYQIDELLFSLMPQIERFEGRLRFGRQAGQGNGGDGDTSLEPPPVQSQVSAPP
jgi:biopolymer transport protein ExbB